MRKRVIAICSAALLLWSCADRSSSTPGGHAHDSHDQDSATPSAVGFGERAGPSEADREIRVVAREYGYDPARLKIAPGEVVTITLVNKGELPHELLVGDVAYHEQHVASGGGHKHGADAATGVVNSGDSASFTWRFPEEDLTLVFACHVADHYQRGMLGSLQVR